jgi:hypothetical protein
MTTGLSLNPQVLDHSRPVLQRSVELATHLGLKLYNRTFRRIDAALYLAEVVTHLQGPASRHYAAEIDQVNDAIRMELARLAAFAGSERRHLEKSGLGKDPTKGGAQEMVAITYTQPATVVLTMRTPHMRGYAEVLLAVEALSRTLDAAWYAQRVTTVQRLDLELLLFRNCMRASINIERLAWGVARRVRDDTELPNYRAMLVKRTGRGLEAANAPAVDQESAEVMTPGEAAHLHASETLASDLLAAESAAATSESRTEDASDRTAPSATLDAQGTEGQPAESASPAPPLAGAEAATASEPTPITPRRRSVRDLLAGATG